MLIMTVLLQASIPSNITNPYIFFKLIIVQMMHVSDHKTQKTFMGYLKLSSDEIVAIFNGAKKEIFYFVG